MTAWCFNVGEMCEKLSNEFKDEFNSIGLVGGAYSLQMHSQGKVVIDKICKYNKPVTKEGLGLAFLYLREYRQSWFEDFEKQLYKAWKSNKKITKMKMEFERDVSGPDDGKHGQLLAKGFADTPHANGVANLYATKSFIINVCNAAVEKEYMSILEIASESKQIIFDEETIQALAKVKTKFPKCSVGGSRALNGAIASKSIINPRADEALGSPNADEDDDETDRVKKEQHRLISLLPLLLEKYSIIGNLELVNAIPTTGKAAKQAKGIKDSTSLNKICAQIAKELNSLSEAAADKNEEEIGTIVDDFFKKHGLTEFSATLLAYVLIVDNGGGNSTRAMTGNYEQCGFCRCFPCFYCDAEDKYMYYFESNGIASWSFSHILSGNVSNTNLPDELSGPNSGKRPLPIKRKGDREKWQGFNGSGMPHLEPYNFQKPVLLGVIDFLDRGKSESADELKIQGGVADVVPDRSRIVFDSPALMALCFKLLEKEVKAQGGELLQVNNRFFKGGALDPEPSAPPGIDLHVQMKDNGTTNTYSVMLTLSDFALLQDSMPSMK